MSRINEQTITSLSDYPCRVVTPEEIAHYHEFGWVQLKRFLHFDIVELLLGRAKQRMGEDGDGNSVEFGATTPYFNPEFGGGLHHPEIREYMEKACQSGKLLLNRRSGVGLRYMTDFYAPKLPAGKTIRNEKMAGNGPTEFHQDFISFGADRTGGMTIWASLGHYGPEAGTMSFVNKSFRLGVLGNYTNYGGRDIREVYPELDELEMSPAIVYEPGDVTVHSHLTVHGAGFNLTDKPRWAYVMVVHPADIHWNGAPSEGCDTTGMKKDDPFPDDRFPVLS